MIQIYNPVGEIAPMEASNASRMGELSGRSVGLVCNHHPAIVGLWAELEQELERDWKPANIERVAKPNISKPQTREQLAKLSEKVDYVLVGVGA